MTILKTRPNDQDVTEYISKIENPQTRQDSALILEIMLRVTGQILSCGETVSSVSAVIITLMPVVAKEIGF